MGISSTAWAGMGSRVGPSTLQLLRSRMPPAFGAAERAHCSAPTGAAPPPDTGGGACAGGPLVGRLVRRELVAQQGAASFLRGWQLVLGRRPDVDALRDAEEGHLARLRQLAPAHGVRPSLLAPAVSVALLALGAATAALPARFRTAALGEPPASLPACPLPTCQRWVSPPPPCLPAPCLPASTG
jgi:hypothetical protein